MILMQIKKLSLVPSSPSESKLRNPKARIEEIIFDPTVAGLLDLVLSLTIATGLSLALSPYLSHFNIGMLFLMSIVYVATRRGWRLSLASVLLALLSYDYFIIPPRFSFLPSDGETLCSFAIMMILAIIISRRTLLIKRLADNLELTVVERTEELMQANKHLREKEKIQEETLAELASINSTLEHFAKLTVHDLREPLRSTKGFVNILKKRYSSDFPPAALEFINRIAASLERMEALIDGIGELARLDCTTAEFQKVNCFDLLSEALMNLSLEIENKKAEISINESLRAIELVCNRNQMTHVFQNLISNSLKFCRKRPLITIVGSQSDEKNIISVSDNGIGIEKEYQEKLFSSFQRLHSRSDFPGSGLGLALCKTIISNHGGKIWVESDTNTGSTFFFSIPSIQSEDKNESTNSSFISRRQSG
ncbi:MAG: DUF4118 domain-containing protein [Candidatus Obscuribacterales bacterium]|nr:DUF4118 domain-containing protein [Candidatus Obscuribacterales bacterium]